MTDKPFRKIQRSDDFMAAMDPGNPDFAETVLQLWSDRLPDVDASGIPLFVVANAVMLRFKAWQNEVLKRYDINLSDFQILSTLYVAPAGELTASELRSILWLTPGGMTRTIKRLADVGLLATRACDNDKRRVPVRLTTLGKRRARDISKKIADFYADATQDLSPAKEKKIIEGMRLFLREAKID